MKPKSLSKTLTFNKKTIAHLSSNDMQEAHGGAPESKFFTGCCPVTMETWCPTNYSFGGGICCNGCLD